MDTKTIAQQYKETTIKTADSGETILLLYKKAISHLEHSLEYFSQGHVAYDKINMHITKAQEIITELSVALDHKAYPSLVENLLGLYLYFNRELGEANRAKTSDKIHPIIRMLKELLATWKQVASQAVTPMTTMPKRGINIER